MIVEFRNILSGEMLLCLEPTTSGVVRLSAAVLKLAAAYFIGFPVTGLGAPVGLGSGFLALRVFLILVTLSCLGAPVIA